MMSHEFGADVMRRAARRNMNWYHDNLMKVLDSQKEKQVREVEVSIELGKELMQELDEPLPKYKGVPLRTVTPSNDVSLMKPIEQEVLDLIYKSKTKGFGYRYLHQRYKKSPEEKFFFRVATSNDYGWQQKQSRLLGRDVNAGRCALLRETFYRKNNLAPDQPSVAQPSGGETNICSMYHCFAN